MSVGSRMLGMVLGAAAGAAATFVMGRVTSFLYEREDADARAREDAARNASPPATVAAEKLARLAGRELPEERREWAGRIVHWGIGVGAGALYGLLRTPRSDLGLLRGLAFGTSFFLLGDELANPALGLSASPREYPWQAHARGLAGHLTYGLAAEAGLAALSAPFRSRVGPGRGRPDEADLGGGSFAGG